MHSGVELWTSSQHLNSIRCLAVSLKGDIVFSGSADNTVKSLNGDKGLILEN